MKKLICTLLVITMAVALLAGCGATAPAAASTPASNEAPAANTEPAAEAEAPAAGEASGPEGKRVLGIMMSLSDPTWVYLNGIFEEKFTAAGFEYTGVSGENDPKVQMEQIENGVVQGYDLILVIPMTGEAIADACQRAMDDGVFVYSFINDSINHTVYRTVDAAYSGEVAVQYGVEEWALKHFPDAADGSINAVIFGNDSDAHTKERYDAAIEKLKTYPQINIVETRAIEPSSIEGQAATENILTMNPDKEINLWIVLDSAMATGCNAALMAENSGIKNYDDVCMVSNALNEEAAGLMRASLNNESVYRICAASGGNTDLNITEIVEQCVALFNGEEVAAFSPVNVDLVTPDNLADFGW